MIDFKHFLRQGLKAKSKMIPKKPHLELQHLVKALEQPMKKYRMKLIIICPKK